MIFPLHLRSTTGVDNSPIEVLSSNLIATDTHPKLVNHFWKRVEKTKLYSYTAAVRKALLGAFLVSLLILCEGRSPTCAPTPILHQILEPTPITELVVRTEEGFRNGFAYTTAIWCTPGDSEETTTRRSVNHMYDAPMKKFGI